MDNTIPALRDVHLAEKQLRGTYIHARDPRQERQARLIETYNRTVQTDGRVLLKEGGSGSLADPILEFLNLESDEVSAAVIRFTEAYGPLLWHGYTRLESREIQSGEQCRGVSGRTGRLVDRTVWSLPLSRFWREQRQFQAVIELAAAAQSEQERLPQLLQRAADILPEVREAFGGQSGGTTPNRLRKDAKRYFAEYETSAPISSRRSAMAVRAGELVAKVVTNRAPRLEVTFDPEHGFRQVPKFDGVLAVLYFLVVEELPAFRFCANCGAVYFTHRPDKRTCTQRCASLFGKREWARKRRSRTPGKSTTPK